jgi:hypothetical protein
VGWFVDCRKKVVVDAVIQESCQNGWRDGERERENPSFKYGTWAIVCYQTHQESTNIDKQVYKDKQSTTMGHFNST